MTSGILHTGLHELRREWGWLLALGIVLILIGTFALVDAVFVSVFSMLIFGWLLLFAGIIQGIQAFRHRRTGHFFLHVLNAIFSFVIGLILLRDSLAGLLVMTLLLAGYFIVVGIFRIVAALAVRIPGAGWTLLDGIISLLLGILVWAQWPMGALWIIGLFIGINLITNGCSQVMLACTIRSLSTVPV
jgi:uncharacterized membrane protein HdeD (DUF308 family)